MADYFIQPCPSGLPPTPPLTPEPLPVGGLSEDTISICSVGNTPLSISTSSTSKPKSSFLSMIKWKTTEVVETPYEPTIAELLGIVPIEPLPIKLNSTAIPESENTEPTIELAATICTDSQSIETAPTELTTVESSSFIRTKETISNQANTTSVTVRNTELTSSRLSKSATSSLQSLDLEKPTSVPIKALKSSRSKESRKLWNKFRKANKATRLVSPSQGAFAALTLATLNATSILSLGSETGAIMLLPEELKEFLEKTKIPPFSAFILGTRRPQVIFHFTRHAQAMHNLRTLSTRDAVSIHNPALTRKGIKECAFLRQHFPYYKEITHILVSPLRRTIETLLLSFKPLLQDPYKHTAIAWPMLRECGEAPCNWGDSKPFMENLLKDVRIDLSLLKEEWEFERLDFDDGDARAKYTLGMLHEFGEAVIDGKEWNGIDFGAAERKLPPGKDIHVLVVSHGNILAKMAGFQKSHFYNCEVKSYKFCKRSRMDKRRGRYQLKELIQNELRRQISTETILTEQDHASSETDGSLVTLVAKQA